MLIDKPLNHRVLVVRIPEPRVHTNADTLELFDILGYQVVAKKGNFAPGKLAVYIQPDSVVPQTEPFKWLWEEHIGLDGIVPARRRRVTVRKFRKEWSEGLLMPLAELGLLDISVYERPQGQAIVIEGQDVSDLLGITHYEPEEDTPEGNTNAPVRKTRRPKTITGWLRFFWYRVLHMTGIKRHEGSQAIGVSFDAPEYDVVAQKAARSGFANSELAIVTEKLNGSNARYVFLEGVMYVGSHFQWKSPESNNIFTRALKQHPWIETWCRANEGRILYGEVVGDQKGYSYGFDKNKGELGFYAFDIREPNGAWTKPWTITSLGERWSYDQEMTVVPLLYIGLADIEKLKELTDGVSELDHKTIREGIVVSELLPPTAGNRRPRQVKRVSNAFLEKDSK